MFSLLLSLAGGIVVASVLEDAKRTIGRTDKEIAINLGLNPYDWSRAKHNDGRDVGLARLVKRDPEYALEVLERLVALLRARLDRRRDLIGELELVLMCAKTRRQVKAELAPVVERRSA